jgi:hypothetical protein
MSLLSVRAREGGLLWLYRGVIVDGLVQHVGDDINGVLVHAEARARVSTSASEDNRGGGGGDVTEGNVERGEEGVEESDLCGGNGRKDATEKAELGTEEDSEKRGEELGNDDGRQDSQDDWHKLEQDAQVEVFLRLRRVVAGDGGVVEGGGGVVSGGGGVISGGEGAVLLGGGSVVLAGDTVLILQGGAVLRCGVLGLIHGSFLGRTVCVCSGSSRGLGGVGMVVLTTVTKDGSDEGEDEELHVAAR